jgi:hypothetical protein
MEALIAFALFVMLALAVQIVVVVLAVGDRIRLKSLLVFATVSATLFGLCRLMLQ